MTDEFDPEAFELEKRQSFLQVLFKVSRLANEEAIRRVRELTGDERIRVSHTALFPHVDFEGIRLTDLAERLGVTKQATAQLVDELVELGMFEKVPDPTDGRAKLIRFSERGGFGLREGMRQLGALEEEFADDVGPDRLAAAHDVLLELLDTLEGGESK